MPNSRIEVLRNDTPATTPIQRHLALQTEIFGKARPLKPLTGE
jgi:hypothetical protein